MTECAGSAHIGATYCKMQDRESRDRMGNISTVQTLVVISSTAVVDQDLEWNGVRVLAAVRTRRVDTIC